MALSSGEPQRQQRDIVLELRASPVKLHARQQSRGKLG
jgi:hypothetical protein